VQCFVNDKLTIESDDSTWTEGQPGLAKFRDTVAEFKHFQVAKKIESTVISAADAAKVIKPFEGLSAKKPVPRESIELLAKQKGSGDVLRDKARDLEQQAARLREIAVHVHQWRIYDELAKELAKPEEKIDLVYAALLLAKLDNEEVDVDAYRAEFERMGKKLAASLPKKADDKAKLSSLNTFFFEQRGFHGSRGDYYNRSNSYLNEVIDDREGLPITLSILYMELGQRIGLKLAGIDVFEHGETFTEEDAQDRIEERGFTFRDEQIQPIAKKTIIVRMLHNLLRVVREEDDMEAGLRYLDGIVLFDPDALEERFTRSVLLYGKGRKKEALEDVQFLIEHYPEGKERKRMVEYKRMIEREIGDE
jgi:serine protease Do